MSAFLPGATKTNARIAPFFTIGLRGVVYRLLGVMAGALEPIVVKSNPNPPSECFKYPPF
jgi:hypothetical protein